MSYISGFLTFMAIGGFPSFVEDMKVIAQTAEFLLSIPYIARANYTIFGLFGLGGSSFSRAVPSGLPTSIGLACFGGEVLACLPLPYLEGMGDIQAICFGIHFGRDKTLICPDTVPNFLSVYLTTFKADLGGVLQMHPVIYFSIVLHWFHPSFS